MLSLVQKLVNDLSRTRFTRVALDGATELGFDTEGMQGVILSLSREEFYKSMTTYADSGVWQDVYRPTRRGIPLYVKVTVYEAENLVVVSFKRR